tara:strand:+ start:358 stop:597 length:240 start_codon:yes stop_codon:yes gene_type:complete
MWVYKRDGGKEIMSKGYRVQWNGKSCKGLWNMMCRADAISNRVSRKPDDLPRRGLLQRLAGAALRVDNLVRFLVKCEQA